MADDNPNGYDLLVDMLRQWGLQELAPDVLRLLQDGHSQDQVSVLIQDTDAYRKRFSGNDLRRKAGLAALSPAEYLATEASYRRIMESAGLPVGFYDQPSDFTTWIGADVSPNEIQSRVNLAVDAAERLDDGTKQAFWDYYRVGNADLAAYFLDRERALPHLQTQARAVNVGGAGARDGYQFSRQEAERLASSTSVTDAQLRDTVSQAVDVGTGLGRVAGYYGDNYSVSDAANELFFSDTEAKRRRERLAAREQAQFAGAGGLGRSSLGTSQSY